MAFSTAKAFIIFGSYLVLDDTILILFALSVNTTDFIVVEEMKKALVM